MALAVDVSVAVGSLDVGTTGLVAVADGVTSGAAVGMTVGAPVVGVAVDSGGAVCVGGATGQPTSAACTPASSSSAVTS